MRCNPIVLWSLLATVVLPGVALRAWAATSCAAGNPNTTSVLESTPTSDFTVNGNGTVTHGKTGLMWKQCAEGLTGAACGAGAPVRLTWADALKTANSANAGPFAGFADWRLPNKKELESIVEFCGFEPAINQTAFPATPASYFWSGTSYNQNPTSAWVVYYTVGFTGASGKADTAFVRLVRGGQSPGSFDLLSPSGTGCTLDIDGNGSIDALTDGLIVLRAMFGLTGTAVTNAAIGGGMPTRTTWAQIQPYLNANCGTNFRP